MSTPEETEIVEYIKSLAANTAAEKIIWTRVNPTTFQWTKIEGGKPIARLTLQKISKRERVRTPNGMVGIKETINYVLQALDVLTAAQRATVNSEDSADTLPALAVLFDAAGIQASRQGLDFLRRLTE